MTLSTHSVAASPRRRSLRTSHSTRIVAALLAVAALATACGKKGPPLAPFVRVPATVAGVTAARVGDDVFVSFPVPTANVDGQRPADIASLEVYAITATRPPETDEQRKLATLIATLPVRPILPPLPPAAAGVELPPVPLPPGVDRGVPAVVRETLTAETRVVVQLPPKKGELVPVELPDEPVPPFGPLVAPAPGELPRRFYFVVGVSPRGRKAPASTPIAVPLETGSSAPGPPVVTHTESTLTITWAPPPDVRKATIEPLVPVVPVTKPAVAVAPGAAVEPDAAAVPNVAPGVTDDRADAATPSFAPVGPPLPEWLPAKSLSFDTVATTYQLYEVAAASDGTDPLAVTVPSPMTAAPLVGTEHEIPLVTFGVERCFFVRAVDQVSGTVVQSAASATTCITPVDTFPPAAPKSLAAIAGEGVISLIWDANTETDLAGYLVLRGDAPGDTLRAITPEPVAATTFRDTTVRPGSRYVYVVVAVDRATPQNVSAQSNRVEETAR